MYRYETHAHTSETSLCAHSSAEDLIALYAGLGYRGVFITDHFINGNMARDDGPWESTVDRLMAGYEAAKAAGDRLGVDVFFGFEYSYGWCHLLTYGLGREWLLAHPDVCEWHVEEYLRRVRNEGAFVIHAHPFREKVGHIHLFPESVDGVEVINSSRTQEANDRAAVYARMYGLPEVAGSDIHRVSQKLLGYVESPEPFRTVADYFAAMKEGKLSIGILAREELNQ